MGVSEKKIIENICKSKSIRTNDRYHHIVSLPSLQLAPISLSLSPSFHRLSFPGPISSTQPSQRINLATKTRAKHTKEHKHKYRVRVGTLCARDEKKSSLGA